MCNLLFISIDPISFISFKIFNDLHAFALNSLFDLYYNLFGLVNYRHSYHLSVSLFCNLQKYAIY